jgi:hypothetical protein
VLFVDALCADGITALHAFSRDRVEQLRQDMMTAFWEAIQRLVELSDAAQGRWFTAQPWSIFFRSGSSCQLRTHWKLLLAASQSQRSTRHSFEPVP